MEGYVDTSKAEGPVWLMKCPAVVSRSLQSSLSSSTSTSTTIDGGSLPVAKIVVSIDPLLSNDSDPASSQFTMELTGTGLGNVPKFYSMDMSKDFVPMSVFAESEGKISVEGKIFNKFGMRPLYEAIDSYGKLCRDRTNKYVKENRQIQVIGHDNPIIPMPGILQEKKKPSAKTAEHKRTRRDRGEMEEIMFKLFEQQPYWTLKELIHKTDQPEQFMKDILKDLCVYNNKGATQGTYELKPEYKRSIEDPSTSGS